MSTENQNSTVGRLMDEEVIDLRQYWRTLMRNKWGILGFGFVVTVLTILVVFSMKPVYRATATLMIESQQANVVSIEEVYGLDKSNSEYYLTQFEIIKSRKLAEKVVNKLNLQEHPEFNQEPGFSFNWREMLPFELPGDADKGPVDEKAAQQAEFNKFIDAFRTRVTVSPVRKTQLVKITFEANDPRLAAEVANAIGNAYIEGNLEAKLEVTLQASGWLSERLGSLLADKKAAEAKYQAFLDAEDVAGEDGGSSIANKQLELVSNKLIDSQKDRLRLESLNDQIIAAKGSVSRLELVPGVLQDRTVQEFKRSLLEVQLKKSELAKRYGAKHPKMEAVQSELNRAYGALNSQIRSVINGIKSDYKAALASEKSLQKTLESNRTSVKDVQRLEFKRKELKQEVDAKTAIYETFVQRFNETNATGDLNTANARIVDPAIVPVLPAKPKKKLIVVAAFIASLMAGVVFAFLLEALNNTVQTAEDVENKLASTLLGILPLLKASKDNPDPAYREFIGDMSSGFAESVRTIRTGIVLSSLDNPHKVLAVTSTMPGEGKTSVALSMAFALGQMEKVLLIGADMRRPAFHKALGMDKNAVGLSNFVAGTAKLEECIQRHESGGIDVIGSGTIPPNPLELLSSKRFAKALAALEEKYDRIVIDTAPSQSVSDAMVLSPLVGGMIYVVKADSTTYQQAKAGIKRLKDVNAPLIGVVLNQVNTKKASKYYGAEYGGYYDTYGYTEESKNAA
ncbi:GumC family protein [Neptuniibacter sp. SY11_33]|uniref:GumC family protein n=1 Tax=Neptuniibacter sp. SY11_33 TaxID=3398215 RepID=UPI0039F56823